MKPIRFSLLIAGLLALIIVLPSCTITPATDEDAVAYSFGEGEDYENPFEVPSEGDSEDVDVDSGDQSDDVVADSGDVDTSDEQPLEFLTDDEDIEKDAEVGVFYEQKLTVTGDLGDGVKWYVTGLPDGLGTDENSTKVYILGHPTEEGTFEIEVVAEDELDDTRTAQISFDLVVTLPPEDEEPSIDNLVIVEGIESPLSIKMVPAEDGDDGGYTDQDVIDDINSGDYDSIPVAPSFDTEYTFRFAVSGGTLPYEFAGLETEITYTSGFESFFEYVLSESTYDFWNDFDFWDVTMDGNEFTVSEGFGTFMSVSGAYWDHCLNDYDSISECPLLAKDDNPILETTFRVKDGAGDEASFTLIIKARVSKVVEDTLDSLHDCYDNDTIPLPSDQVPGNGPGGW